MVYLTLSSCNFDQEFVEGSDLLKRLKQHNRNSLPFTTGLEDKLPLKRDLPDTSGLFFGKRSENYDLPDTSGLFFGKRTPKKPNLPDTSGLFFGKRNDFC